LLVDISGRVYHCSDWSVTGISVLDLKEKWNINELKKVKIILPLKDASLSISIQLKLKNHRDNKFGFEFHELDIKNKRILRHYIEMAVDGRTDTLEDLVGITAGPSIESPIANALNLSEIDEHKLVKKFKIRSLISVFIGAIVSISLLLIASQNYIYQVKAIGNIEGNSSVIYSPFEGIVDNIFINDNDFIQKNDPIIYIKNPNDSAAISELKVQISQLESQIPVANKKVNFIVESHAVLRLLNKREQRLKANLNNAIVLYKEKVITKQDVEVLEEKLWLVSMNLEKERNRLSENLQSQQRLSNKDRLYANSKINDQINFLKQKLAMLGSDSNFTLHSKVEGQLLSTLININEPISTGDAIAIVRNTSTPYIMVRISNKERLKVKVGQEAKIFIPFYDDYLTANVTSFNSTSIASSFSGKTDIKLEFTDQNINIPADTKVDVWIKTIEWLF
jgi:multidrug resistance efflux pump